MTFMSGAGSVARAAPKEKQMKRTIPLWLGLLAFALLPALAQKATPMGKIHGHVTSPAGISEVSGNIILSTDGGHNIKYTFPYPRPATMQGKRLPAPTW